MFLDDLKADRDLYRKISEGKRLSKKEVEACEDLRNKYGIREDWTVRTQAALANLFGVSSRTVIRWKKTGGLPVEVNGSYNVFKVIKWNAEIMDREDPDGPYSEKTKWETTYREFRAKLAELEYRRVSGELIEVAKVEALFADRAAALKQSLLGRARRLSHRIAMKASDEVYQLLEEDAIEALQAYSRKLDLVPDKNQSKINGESRGGQDASDGN